jgi:hypothetical protein
MIADEDAEKEIEEPVVKQGQTVQEGDHFVHIGDLRYSNEVVAPIGLHENRSQAYGLQIRNQQVLEGVHVGSHRFVTNYQPVNSIAIQPMLARSAYEMFNAEIVNRYSGGHTGFSPIYRMKEALISMAAFGEGNTRLQANPEVLATFNGFIEILRVVLPKELEFIDLLIRPPDVLLNTKTGDFILDASSGGVNALIEVAWQIYLYSIDRVRFTVTMDEPENHLHPSMQRHILPNLISAFPQACFIVATHSPFIVSAVEDSFVYVLRYFSEQENNRDDMDQNVVKRYVKSERLDYVHKGGSASDILREVLGVPVTMPQWVQGKVDGIILRHRGQELNNALLDQIRSELAAAGLGELYPQALAELVKNVDQAN